MPHIIVNLFLFDSLHNCSPCLAVLTRKAYWIEAVQLSKIQCPTKQYTQYISKQTQCDFTLEWQGL